MNKIEQHFQSTSLVLSYFKLNTSQTEGCVILAELLGL